MSPHEGSPLSRSGISEVDRAKLNKLYHIANNFRGTNPYVSYVCCPPTSLLQFDLFKILYSQPKRFFFSLFLFIVCVVNNWCWLFSNRKKSFFFFFFLSLFLSTNYLVILGSHLLCMSKITQQKRKSWTVSDVMLMITATGYCLICQLQNNQWIPAVLLVSGKNIDVHKCKFCFVHLRLIWNYKMQSKYYFRNKSLNFCIFVF